MSSIYDTTQLLNLHAVKEALHWHNQKFINAEQLAAIKSKYQCKLYHPNLAIRILIFVASWMAISGASGLFFLLFNELSKPGYGVLLVIIGAGILFFVQRVLIYQNNHFRSGVVEACAYCALGSIVGGIGMITDGNEHLVLLTGVVVCAYMSYRFLDLLCHIVGMLTFAGFIFYEGFQAGGIFRHIIPFMIIVCFSVTYFLASHLRKRDYLSLWSDNLKLTEIISLLLIYAGGNYLVVRECSIELLDMTLAPGEDIPFAFIFYALTAGIPLLLIYRGTKLGRIMLIRLGVVALVLSVSTFRYYYSIASPEVVLTLGGVAVLSVTAWLFNILKVKRGVFTRDKLLSKQWISPEASAFAISQTMGGNVQKTDETFKGGGGSFGGGGASGDY